MRGRLRLTEMHCGHRKSDVWQSASSGRSTGSRSGSHGPASDPPEPVGVFCANDRSTLETDVSQPRRGNRSSVTVVVRGWRSATKTRPRVNGSMRISPRSECSEVALQARTGDKSPELADKRDGIVANTWQARRCRGQCVTGSRTSPSRRRQSPRRMRDVPGQASGCRRPAKTYARPISTAARRIRRSPSSAK
jgi:hypothetical protein